MITLSLTDYEANILLDAINEFDGTGAGEALNGVMEQLAKAIHAKLESELFLSKGKVEAFANTWADVLAPEPRLFTEGNQS